MKNIEKDYIDSIYEVAKTLRSTYEAIATNYRFDLSKPEISDAIALRLKAYYSSQNNIKQLLNKGYLAAGADFFVESVLFFVKLYLKQNAPHLTAVSEKEILISKHRDEDGKMKREVVRPDIAIYNDGEPSAIIECKTQLGRNRLTWERDYISRKNLLAKKYPATKTFLFVMTSLNWEGFGSNPKLGQEYFCLLNGVWPTTYETTDQLGTRVEDLLIQLH